MKLLRSLLLLPPILLVVHFFGYAFAVLVAPLQAARRPLVADFVERPPLIVGYFDHLGGLLRLNPGPLSGDPSGRSLLTAIGEATLASLGLLTTTMAASLLVGLLLGIVAVRRNPPQIAGWLTGATATGLAMPSFFLGTLGVTGIIMLLIYGPVGLGPILPLEGFGWDRHIILPTLVLMLRPTAQIAQMTASLMIDEYQQQYVTTARSLGHHERRIATRHVFRNIVAPLAATINSSLRLLVGELIIVESLFYWPGLGFLLAQVLIPADSSIAPEAALFLDPPLLAVTLALIALIFFVGSALSSAVARRADPRLR